MKSVKNAAEISFEEKKSKFIGSIGPVSTRAEAEAFVAAVRTRYPDATHHCSAWKVTERGQEYYRVDDDGEPSGTAGKPMGDVLGYMGVENVVVVATRYFGGVKLGAGGLVRSYARCAKLAVEAAGPVEFIQKWTYIVEFPYDRAGEAETLLKDERVEIIERGYGDKISCKVKLPAEIRERLANMKNILLVALEPTGDK